MYLNSSASSPTILELMGPYSIVSTGNLSGLPQYDSGSSEETESGLAHRTAVAKVELVFFTVVIPVDALRHASVLLVSLTPERQPDVFLNQVGCVFLQHNTRELHTPE
jgi:hypothetical protein